MITTINKTEVKIEVVTYLGDMEGTFHADEDTIRLLKGCKNIHKVLIHELTHAYLYYYGFSGAELTEELVCNFVEIYGEEIITVANKLIKEEVK